MVVLYIFCLLILFGAAAFYGWWNKNKYVVKANVINQPDLAWYRKYLAHVDDFISVIEGDWERKKFKEEYVENMPPIRIQRLREAWDCSWNKDLSYNELLDLMVISGWPYHISSGYDNNKNAQEIAYNHLKSTGKTEWNYTCDGNYLYSLKRTDLEKKG